MALVDDADLPLVVGRSWRLIAKGKDFYTSTEIGGRTLLMHRIITGAASGMLVDHIDGNGLNNQRSNIRITDQQGNQRNRTKLSAKNRSGFTGVTWYRNRMKWMAQIINGGSHVTLGYFDSVTEAAEVRRAAEVLLFGEHAPKVSRVSEKYVQKFNNLKELRSFFCPTRTAPKSGCKGVYPNGGKWMARKTINGVDTYLGNFATVELASEAVRSRNGRK